MKKFLFICSACLMLFACGSNQNQGIELTKKYQQALENGEYEKAEVYLELLEEWANSTSAEELADYSTAVEDWCSEAGEAVRTVINDIYDEAEEFFSDSTNIAVMESVAEEVIDVVSEYAAATEAVIEEYENTYSEDLENTVENTVENVLDEILELF